MIAAMLTTRKARGTVGVTAAALLALTLGACGGSDDAAAASGCETTYEIGFSHPISEAAFVKGLKSQVTAQAKEIGCVEVLFDDTQASDLESQRNTVETWVTQGVDAVVVFPVDAKALTPLRTQAQSAGIKWLQYATPGEGVDGYTGFDNVASGDIVGQAAVDWITEHQLSGKVTAAITSITAVPDVRGRWEQPQKLISDAGVEVISLQDCSDQTCGLEQAEALLNANPDLRIYIGANDDAALGALKAFQSKGIDPSEVFIAGQDGNIEALKAVKAGGAYKVSAAIDMIDLSHAIVQNSINAITGSGETETEAAVIPASLDDPSELDELIAQQGG
ncbi:sugar ABC transporter substrate-binding protein [Nakamurella leprariae]|uniref:Sugar ABC transporter substrate-binding protein n=1 Tax=Nakamurella leprariae TaxID=2803911 RepID=A0A939BWW7_9ACTN|nr:sugar ABC transporter substrate-binding protein [Nakamurella leprariae]MBM9467963.1 sugar ABC transporter substrate-binding protein [Nakamurella leprariae]